MAASMLGLRQAHRADVNTDRGRHDRTIELLAAYFTIAGDIYPLGPTEISPFPFRDRVEAAARAGYRGIGLHHADTMHTAGKIGLPEMRRILDGNGIKYVELEFLLDWFEDGERRRESDKMRSEIFAVADALGLRKIKVGPGFHEPVADIPRDARRLCPALPRSGGARYRDHAGDHAVEQCPYG